VRRVSRWWIPSSLLVVALSSVAHAEETKLDAADGVPECHSFHAKNERELTAWEKDQPKTPYVYPRERTVLGAPWTGLFEGFRGTVALLAATAVPHVGAQMRGDEPAAFVSWPWSIPFGPASTCTRPQGSFKVDDQRTHRALVEPGFASSTRGLGVFVRPGYRFLLHPSDWVVGVGGGVGSTIEIAGQREPFRASVSPEVLFHFGHCCEPGYFVLAFRYDRFFGGGVKNVLGGSLGFTYF
jgi:hypothetical protein